MAGPMTATVETLTAEVRVLMVGSRQVTLSVYRQLDKCRLAEFIPMGRVNATPRCRPPKDPDYAKRSVCQQHGLVECHRRIELVGKDLAGNLVRAEAAPPPYAISIPGSFDTDDAHRDFSRLLSLPLIVLAGLK